MGWKFWKKKPKEISEETKATLEVLIHEIQQIIKAKKVSPLTHALTFELEILLDSWIKANNLHPEQVITINSTATNTYYTISTASNTYNDSNTDWAHFNINSS